jgi:hypothetical protein
MFSLAVAGSPVTAMFEEDGGASLEFVSVAWVHETEVRTRREKINRDLASPIPVVPPGSILFRSPHDEERACYLSVQSARSVVRS